VAAAARESACLKKTVKGGFSVRFDGVQAALLLQQQQPRGFVGLISPAMIARTDGRTVAFIGLENAERSFVISDSCQREERDMLIRGMTHCYAGYSRRRRGLRTNFRDFLVSGI
jgi:hypothetical protein